MPLTSYSLYHFNVYLHDMLPRRAPSCLKGKKNPYQREKQFLEIFDQAYDNLRNGAVNASEYLLFKSAKKSSPGISCTDSDAARFWASYDVSQQLLLIQVGTLEHSQATQFNHLLVLELQPMRLCMALQRYSMVTIVADRTVNCKHGDHGCGPIRPAPGRSRKFSLDA